ncbi:unnamed protein product [Adineta ricciae]|uniref:Aspartyl/asparaginy/proline hydroxylase domain-containing protein n=1 Tax=Adineta ricciae TaxID=249248 RepID=A0A813YXM8_ADIRI|nr:unnamed protein product [Adineta ricciae]CAF0976347.1 unnamed protein product [Adineta ricciae]
MLKSLQDSYELLRDQVWFFRFFVIMGVVCVYRILLHFVLRSNHCPNPFCSKCLGAGSVRGRAINRIKQDYNDEDNRFGSIIHNNLAQHDRLCSKNDEKPTVYFHRGLSSTIVDIADQKILVEHYQELRQEIVKYFQENETVSWTHLHLYENGKENSINCKKFPKLFEILQSLPNAICVNSTNCLFGNCFLTFSSSEQIEEASKGLTNCSIRMHFGLLCDEQSPAYVLLNKRKRLTIQNQQSTTYNHAVEHSIKNPQEGKQVFVTIDFWHPDLANDMRQQLASIFNTDLA